MKPLPHLATRAVIALALLLLVLAAACENDVFGPGATEGEPTCQVREAAIDFGTMILGDISPEKTFFIRNTGGGTLGGQVALDSGDFEIVSGGGAYSLAPGQLRRVAVRFRPGQAGDRTGQVRLGTACRFVELSGRATPGDACRIEPDTLDFGTLAVGGGAVERTFTITNIGPRDFSGAVEAPCGSFTIIQGGGLYSLAPSQSRLVTIRFSPTGAGSETCLIETGPGACLDVTAVGIGTNPPMCEVVPAAVTFAAVCPGSMAERTVTLRNAGSSPFSGVVLVSGAGFALVSGGGEFQLGAGEMRPVVVRFEPAATGAAAGSLSFGVGACPPVTLSGEAGVPVVCQLSTTELSLGTLPVGQTGEGSFSITNLGCGNASGMVAASCGPFTVVEGAGAWTLGAGGSRLVRVRFSPVTAGGATCQLAVGGGCGSIQLAGEGIEVPLCAVTPELLDFGSILPNSNQTRTFSIRNDGGGLLTGSVASGCDVFTVIGGGGAFSLGAGASRTVTVRFQPTGPGDRSCQLGLGTAGCPAVTLVGAGDTPPLCSLVPSVLQFGGVTVNTSSEKSFVLSNAGGGTLSGMISENCNEFDILDGAGAYNLTAGQSRTVTVRFRPTIQGARTCGIGLGSASCNNVAASGTGTAAGLCRITPSDLDFGTVFIGQSADRSFTLTNLGGTTISGTIAESCAEYSLVSGAGAYSLGQGQSVTVIVRFTPVSTGSRLCDIETGSPDCPGVPATAFGDVEPVCQLSATSLDFGTVTVNQSADRTLMITNIGGGTLSGAVAETCNDFKVLSGGGPFSLGAGQSRSVVLRFQPLTAGVKSCPLATGTTGCAAVTLEGVADAPPDCALSTPSLNFPLTPVGGAAELGFMISNVGGGVLSGSVSAVCPEFTVVAGAGAYNLSAGQSRAVTVRFMPAAAGSRFCTIETGGSDCPDLTASGQGDPPPLCALSPPDLDFGGVGIGVPADRSFEIRNNGGGTLSGTPAITGCPDFSIVSGGGSYALTAGQSRTVTVRFQPAGTGVRNCTVETGSALCADLPAAGTGQTQPMCSLSATSLSYGPVTTGQSSDRSFMITNSGGGTLSGSVSENCTQFSLVAGAGAYSLTAGQSRTVTLRFSPTTSGAMNCTVDLGSGCMTDVTASGTGAVGFASSVRPILIASGCTNVGCHDGFAQFDVSIYANAVGVTNANNHAGSLLLTKPGDPPGDHGGGNFANFQMSHPDYITILTWIQQGVRP